MYWCVSCQTYFDAPACPACHDAGVFSPALLPVQPGEADEYIINNGMWNIDSLGLRIAAAQSPEFNRLMVAVRSAERAEADDMVRVGRLPRPQYGDGHHRQLSNAVNRARAAAIDHLLAHWQQLLVVQRHLG